MGVSCGVWGLGCAWRAGHRRLAAANIGPQLLERQARARVTTARALAQRPTSSAPGARAPLAARESYAPPSSRAPPGRRHQWGTSVRRPPRVQPVRPARGADATFTSTTAHICDARHRARPPGRLPRANGVLLSASPIWQASAAVAAARSRPTRASTECPRARDYRARLSLGAMACQ